MICKHRHQHLICGILCVDVSHHRFQYRERKVAFQCIASGALALDMVHVKPRAEEEKKVLRIVRFSKWFRQTSQQIERHAQAKQISKQMNHNEYHRINF